METVLITGASSGIGKATAELFSLKGWNVAATMRDIKKASCFKNFKNINCYMMDVTNIETVNNCIGQIIQEHGKIDVLINNAGVYETDPLENASFEQIDQTIKTNVYGVLNVTKAILPHFRINNRGIIINISSIAGRATFPFQSVYHLTKWAVEGFSEGLRYELNKLNVKVKTMAPSSVKTDLWNNLIKQPIEQYSTEYKRDFVNWFDYLNGNIQKGFYPEHEAKVIYKAATDGKNKFRYSSDFTTKVAIFLHLILPTNLFQLIISKQVKL